MSEQENVSCYVKNRENEQSQFHSGTVTHVALAHDARPVTGIVAAAAAVSDSPANLVSVHWLVDLKSQCDSDQTVSL
jgi:hypothetical protein